MMNGEAGTPTLEVALADLAASLPKSVVSALVTRLERLEGRRSEAAVAAWVAGTPEPDVRARLERLVRVWRGHQDEVSPRGLAFALRAAAAAASRERRRQRIELAWTGPTPEGTVVRRTAEALLQLIEGARESLVLVTFAAYPVERLSAALERAINRGVAVTLVLESRDESGGRVGVDPIRAFGQLSGRIRVLVWPLEARPRDEAGASGVLHVKCALADERKLFVSSANLTGHAMTLNMELGVVVTGGRLPSEFAEHLVQLERRGVLVERSAHHAGAV